MRMVLAPVVVIWGFLLAGGVAALMRYERTPGPVAPPQSPLETASGLRVVMYAHPRCPCTRASITELARVLRETTAPDVSCDVRFYRPDDQPDSWAHSETWRAASAIPGVRVLTDPDAREARRHGALTSGHVVVASGEATLYSGGITAARGAVGKSTGAASLARALSGWSAPDAAVFGCLIVPAEPIALGERP